jgi:hypothetical protein
MAAAVAVVAVAVVAAANSSDLPGWFGVEIRDQLIHPSFRPDLVTCAFFFATTPFSCLAF